MKKIIIALTVIGIAILGVFLWQDDKEEEKAVEVYSEMEEKLIPLNVEKRELEKQLAAIDRESKEARREKGTVIVLFVELTEQVHKEIYPVMKKYGYKGVLALSEKQFPGAEGCMSEKQFKELLNDGWSYCATWEKKRSIDVWHIFMEQKMKKLGLEQKSAMYFPTSTYKKGYNESLKEYGYSIVAHHGERNLTLYPKTTKEGEFWYPGVCGMSGEGPKTKLREVAGSGSNIIYTIGFTRRDELYDKDTFDRMLQEFKKHEEEGDIFVTDFEEARKYHLEKEKTKGEKDLPAEERKAIIQEKIDEVNERIDALYAEYVK